MTNEEKANEICGGNWRVFNKEYAAALEMAEWKDQQFKEYLEKKMLNISFVTALNTKKEIQRKEIETSVYYKIINELFKETD